MNMDKKEYLLADTFETLTLGETANITEYKKTLPMKCSYGETYEMSDSMKKVRNEKVHKVN